MTDEQHETEGEPADEAVEKQEGELLPDREAMSVLLPPGPATIAPDELVPPADEL
jgi:hypothetical protein